MRNKKSMEKIGICERIELLLAEHGLVMHPEYVLKRVSSAKTRGHRKYARELCRLYAKNIEARNSIIAADLCEKAGYLDLSIETYQRAKYWNMAEILRRRMENEFLANSSAALDLLADAGAAVKTGNIDVAVVFCEKGLEYLKRSKTAMPFEAKSSDQDELKEQAQTKKV